MRVRSSDLAVSDPALKSELLDAVDRVLTHGRVLLGPEVDEFEEALADICGRRYAVGVGSGSEALYFSLRCLDIGAGDEVITTSLSWIATFNAIAMTGATPIAIDVREDQNIDPACIEAAITPRTKAIVVVHFTGRVCEMEPIMEIAARRGLHVVEDAAQAFKACDDQGRRAGSFGVVAAFSMNAIKLFGSYGEAGAVVTDDSALRERLATLRYNGTVNRETCVTVSLNGRLDTLQAAMMLVNLHYIDGWIERRREIAAEYRRLLGNVVVCPEEPEEIRHVYHTYGILAERRDDLMRWLEDREIEAKIHHPILMPDQPAYSHLPRPDIPVARQVVGRILSLPNHEKMSDEQVACVTDSVRAFYEAG
jgi:dTDP-4-amino-4,6-dideoxygalactose transaminase